MALAQGLTGKGVKAGLSLATLVEKSSGDFELIGDSDTRTGICAGGFLTFGVGTWLEIQPELLYAQRGAQYGVTVRDEVGDSSDGTMKWNINYLEIPVLARVVLPVAGRFVPGFYVGPALALKLAARGKGPCDALLVDCEEVDEELDWVAGSDFLLVFGTSFDVGMSKARFVIDVRYQVGLTAINDPVSSSVPKIKNRAFTVTAGYGF